MLDDVLHNQCVQDTDVDQVMVVEADQVMVAVEDQVADRVIVQVIHINHQQEKPTPAPTLISIRKQEEPIIHYMCIIDLLIIIVQLAIILRFIS